MAYTCVEQYSPVNPLVDHSEISVHNLKPQYPESTVSKTSLAPINITGINGQLGLKISPPIFLEIFSSELSRVPHKSLRPSFVGIAANAWLSTSNSCSTFQRGDATRHFVKTFTAKVGPQKHGHFQGFQKEQHLRTELFVYSKRLGIDFSCAIQYSYWGAVFQSN